MAEKIFSTAQEVKKYEHVIFFTCGLMTQPDFLLEVVCCKLLTEFQQVSCKISEKSLWGVKFLVNLHAEICVTRHNSFVWTGQKVGVVLGPNKLCVCISDAAQGFTNYQTRDGWVAECASVTDSLCSVDQFKNLCMDCFNFRNFILSSLCLIVDKRNDSVDEDEENAITKVVLENFKLPQNVSMAMVRNCPLSKSAYNHIVQQFHNCKKLQLLHLEKLDDVPMEIIRAIPKMHSLDIFRMNDCKCETETFIAAAKALRHCCDLKSLSFMYTKGVPPQFAETLSKMTSMELLNLENCRMRLPASKAVMQALPNCCQLEHLSLWGNILTNCIADFLSADNHSGFCNLTSLDLAFTNLSRDDVANLGSALRSAKLPKVSDLNLSYNNLFNCVKLLFDSSTVISLQTLDLEGTKLGKSDMIYLSDVVDNKRLPKLESLAVCDNNLCSMEDETKALLLSCVGQYTEAPFDLNLGRNDLSDVFLDEAAALCFGTKIKLTPLSVSRSFDIMRVFHSIFPEKI